MAAVATSGGGPVVGYFSDYPLPRNATGCRCPGGSCTRVAELARPTGSTRLSRGCRGSRRAVSYPQSLIGTQIGGLAPASSVGRHEIRTCFRSVAGRPSRRWKAAVRRSAHWTGRLHRSGNASGTRPAGNRARSIDDRPRIWVGSVDRSGDARRHRRACARSSPTSSASAPAGYAARRPTPATTPGDDAAGSPRLTARRIGTSACSTSSTCCHSRLVFFFFRSGIPATCRRTADAKPRKRSGERATEVTTRPARQSRRPARHHTQPGRKFSTTTAPPARVPMVQPPTPRRHERRAVDHSRWNGPPSIRCWRSSPHRHVQSGDKHQR